MALIRLASQLCKCGKSFCFFFLVDGGRGRGGGNTEDGRPVVCVQGIRPCFAASLGNQLTSLVVVVSRVAWLALQMFGELHITQKQMELQVFGWRREKQQE